MAPSFRMIVAVLWVFLCVAVFYVASCPRRRRVNSPHCKVDEKVFHHEAIFTYPSGSCYVYKCYYAMVKWVKNECRFNGRCYKLNAVWHSGDKTFRCILNKEKKADYKEINKGNRRYK
ncbi:hypothetical protein PoB_007068700 [Plakobranchus ocellatus]|uniref:Secreted protein n=1 Tax=Plakobranchus ocellatus TaxID=259542 RepID=A0AAV4DJG0_9GAST|nr:hypothetical protein PoB_007068700 [Plakobranchus ocellatus]